jgi:hypothetical protein
VVKRVNRGCRECLVVINIKHVLPLRATPRSAGIAPSLVFRTRHCAVRTRPARQNDPAGTTGHGWSFALVVPHMCDTSACPTVPGPRHSRLQQLHYILPNLRRASCAPRIRQWGSSVVNDQRRKASSDLDTCQILFKQSCPGRSRNLGPPKNYSRGWKCGGDLQLSEVALHFPKA